MPVIDFNTKVQVGNNLAKAVYRGTTVINSNPRSILFSSSEPGIWFDPSDLSTLFQDAAGTTPVTTPGQTVALALDKSKGLVLGPELVTNGDFASDTVWAKGSNWTIANGAASVSGQTATTYLSQAILTTGKTYEVIVDASGSSLGRIQLGNTGTNYQLVSGRNRFVGVCAGNTNLIVTALVGNSFSIDNISVRELPGNHATQATAAARPTYGIEPEGGRRNLLNMTDNLAGWTLQATPDVTSDGTLGGEPAFRLTDNDTTLWEALLHPYTANTLRSGNYVVSIRIKKETTASSAASFRVDMYTGGPTEWAGAVINPISGDVITGTAWSYGNRVTSVDDMGTYWQVTMRFTVSSGHYISSFQIFPAHFNLTMSNVGVTNVGSNTWAAPQLEVGSTPTAYQRVTSQYNITEVGKNTLHYIQFDGVDDFLVTSTIAPGTDKAQVFAGVRKLSDAARATLVELTSGAGNRFFVDAPGGANPSYAFGSQGLAGLSWAGVTSGYPAPDTAVITGIGDISADISTLRRNGIQIATNALDQGSGVYQTQPLYIGRRGGTSQPFNGRIYGLIVRFGANLNAVQVNQIEKFVGFKTGVTIP